MMATNCTVSLSMTANYAESFTKALEYDSNGRYLKCIYIDLQRYGFATECSNMGNCCMYTSIMSLSTI